MEEELNLHEEEQQVETYVLNIRKFKRRLIISSVSIVLALITMLIPKYHDFDVIFKAVYNLRYEEYVISSNLGSIGFVFGFNFELSKFKRVTTMPPVHTHL